MGCSRRGTFLVCGAKTGAVARQAGCLAGCVSLMTSVPLGLCQPVFLPRHLAPVQDMHVPARASARERAGRHQGATAFSVDPRSFQLQELAPRAANTNNPPDRDLDVWLPPEDAPPGQLGAPTSREQTRREREEAYERQRRESLPPGGSAGALWAAPSQCSCIRRCIYLMHEAGLWRWGAAWSLEALII